jgi:hypothetical protein
VLVITGARYNRVNLCINNLTQNSVRYNRVFVNNRVRYNRVSLYMALRPCVPLTQLVKLDFRELLDSTLTKLVIGYITRDLYITSFVENNEFLAIITSFFAKNSEFLAIITSFLPKIASFLTKMTSFLTKNSVYNENNDKTRYITAKLVI